MKRILNRTRVRTICTCALIASAALVQTPASADQRADTTADVRVQGDKSRPYLIFGCDRQTGISMRYSRLRSLRT